MGCNVGAQSIRTGVLGPIIPIIRKHGPNIVLVVLEALKVGPLGFMVLPDFFPGLRPQVFNEGSGFKVLPEGCASGFRGLGVWGLGLGV